MAATPKRPILIVDDEPEMLHSLKHLLRHDYQVFTATSGAEGLKILENEVIHLVMTDQRMPEMTGVEMLNQVKNEHPAAIRLIFTGYAEVASVVAAINTGNVFRFLSKPWEPEELLAVLKIASEHHDHIVERHSLMLELTTFEQECNQFSDQLLAGNFGTLNESGADQATRLQDKSRQFLGRLQRSLAATAHQSR
jgi:response regulator RpfG family c-di-GMP phosphodiesterase